MKCFTLSKLQFHVVSTTKSQLYCVNRSSPHCRNYETVATTTCMQCKQVKFALQQLKNHSCYKVIAVTVSQLLQRVCCVSSYSFIVVTMCMLYKQVKSMLQQLQNYSSYGFIATSMCILCEQVKSALQQLQNCNCYNVVVVMVSQLL